MCELHPFSPKTSVGCVQCGGLAAAAVDKTRPPKRTKRVVGAADDTHDESQGSTAALSLAFERLCNSMRE